MTALAHLLTDGVDVSSRDLVWSGHIFTSVQLRMTGHYNYFFLKKGPQLCVIVIHAQLKNGLRATEKRTSSQSIQEVRMMIKY